MQQKESELESVDWSIPALVARYMVVSALSGTKSIVYRYREGYYWEIHIQEDFLTSELHNSYSECMTDLKHSLEEKGMKFNWWQVYLIDCRGMDYATN